ncbi:MAG: class I SAM-dependent methyltransferase [Planctomycetota bacterium]
MSRVSKLRDELAPLSRALVGPHGEALIALLHQLNLQLPIDGVGDGAIELAESLGLVSRGNDTAGAASPGLTMLGLKAADPARELTFWRERAGAMPGGGVMLGLLPTPLAGQRILEVGSGVGCNLLSLQALGAEVIGVDVEPTYLLLAPVLAELAARPEPRVACSRAERLAFAAETFDVVICIGALQYMDYQRCLPEMVRVLRRGGVLMTTSVPLFALVRSHFRRNWRRPVELARDVRIVVNSLYYQVFGRRLKSGENSFSTSAPVYPTARYLRRVLHASGLAIEKSVRMESEVWLRCVKR